MQVVAAALVDGGQAGEGGAGGAGTGGGGLRLARAFRHASFERAHDVVVGRAARHGRIVVRGLPARHRRHLRVGPAGVQGPVHVVGVGMDGRLPGDVDGVVARRLGHDSLRHARLASSTSAVAGPASHHDLRRGRAVAGMGVGHVVGPVAGHEEVVVPVGVRAARRLTVREGDLLQREAGLEGQARRSVRDRAADLRAVQRLVEEVPPGRALPLHGDVPPRGVVRLEPAGRAEFTSMM